METTRSLAAKLLALPDVPIALLAREYGHVLLEDIALTDDHDIEMPQPGPVVVLT